MGVIKINNIIYGSNNASDILYKNITVEEKLDTIPIFDINDNGAVVVESDVLTYGHIVDNLNSTESNKILSAKQGKILSEKIDNIDLSYLEEDILAVENKIDNFQVAKKITQAAYDALPEEEKNNGIYVIEDDEGNIFVARNIEYDGSKTGLGATVQQAIDNMLAISQIPDIHTGGSFEVYATDAGNHYASNIKATIVDLGETNDGNRLFEMMLLINRLAKGSETNVFDIWSIHKILEKTNAISFVKSLGLLHPLYVYPSGYNAGYGAYAIVDNSGQIGIGRYYTADLAVGGWPETSIPTGVYQFSLKFIGKYI